MSKTFAPGQDPPAKGRGVSLEEAAATCADVGTSMEQLEMGRVEAGWVALPDDKILRQAHALREAARLIDMITPHWPRIRSMIAPREVKPKPSSA